MILNYNGRNRGRVEEREPGRARMSLSLAPARPSPRSVGHIKYLLTPLPPSLDLVFFLPAASFGFFRQWEWDTPRLTS